MRCMEYNTNKIRVLAHDTRILFDSEFEKLGFTGQQGAFLIYIVKNGPVHQNDIEQQFGLSKSTVSGIVKRMLAKDIITKESEYPFVTIRPTDKAKELVKQMDEARDRINERLLKGFSEEEKKTVGALLDRMLENVKEEK